LDPTFALYASQKLVVVQLIVIPSKPLLRREGSGRAARITELALSERKRPNGRVWLASFIKLHHYPEVAGWHSKLNPD